jgi:septum site-determining protein MinC
MAAQSPGRARACFDLKRTTYPLFSLVLRTADLAEVQRELQARLGESPDFFDQDLLVLNLEALRDEDRPIDFPALLAMLRAYRVQPIGAHGGGPSQMAAAAAAGLVATPEVSAASSMARSTRAEAGHGGPAGGSASPGQGSVDEGAIGGASADLVSQRIREAAAVSASGTPPTAAPAPDTDAGFAPAPAAILPASTLVIDKPLRSGQRVYARGADLVLLDVVSHGAEVIADGNIHVYAPLRGRAIAGALGNEAARIFTTCLDAQLIAIAGVYRTAETPLPPAVAGMPAQVRLVGDSLLIEPLEFPALNTKDKL